MEKDLSYMLKNLCCSQCKIDLDGKSVKFLHQDKDYKVINITCRHCGKDFGTIFLKLTDNISENIDDLILKDIRDKAPINTNEVIDAHEYIKEFETNWKKFIDED